MGVQISWYLHQVQSDIDHKSSSIKTHSLLMLMDCVVFPLRSQSYSFMLELSADANSYVSMMIPENYMHQLNQLHAIQMCFMGHVGFFLHSKPRGPRICKLTHMINFLISLFIQQLQFSDLMKASLGQHKYMSQKLVLNVYNITIALQILLMIYVKQNITDFLGSCLDTRFEWEQYLS